MSDISQKIFSFLDNENINFKVIEHEPAPTCEISAELRGESIEIGGKTLLMKDKKGFKLFVISAALQSDNKKIRKILKSDKLRFATKEELKDLCGVESGALPPLGRPFYDFDLFVDESVFKNKKIAFNAGILTKSVILDINDYKKLVTPIICQFSK